MSPERSPARAMLSLVAQAAGYPSASVSDCTIRTENADEAAASPPSDTCTEITTPDAAARCDDETFTLSLQTTPHQQPSFACIMHLPLNA